MAHFGKRLLRKWSGNDYFSTWFIFIQWCDYFPKMHKLPF